MSSPTAQRNARGYKSLRYSFLFRLLHWVLPVAMILLVLTGLSLHAVARPAWSVFSGTLPAWAWPGRVGLWHLIGALVFVPGIVAVAFHFGRFWLARPSAKLWLLLSGLTLAVTGLLLLHPAGPPALYTSARTLHGAVGLFALPVALLWHVIDGLTRHRGRLTAAFWRGPGPRWLPLAGLAAVSAAAPCLIVNGLPVVPPWSVLEAARIAPPAAGDQTVDLTALPWADARPLRVEMFNGLGFRDGRTTATLRALHDGERLFVKAEWLDPNEDRRYRPWRRTEDGWKHMVTNPDDEQVYMEDKFSLVFPIEPDLWFDRFGCAASCHATSTRDYGYKASSRLIDVWHWKATRTDPVGQVDDQYWTVADFELKNVGRLNDPKESGGYETNVSEDKTHPAWLSEAMELVRDGVILREHAVEYTPEEAGEIRPGTTIPGMVVSPMVGDRGDVRCVSEHREGRWRVYIERALDTGSPHDAPFVVGQPLPFTTAAFDHTAKRHAYNYTVYRLLLLP
ncbi:MAG: ethylbenzene dehydrogenase-related protein [Thermoguttaceae bacterium]|jgi:hypothetical protein|nr:ethylbenzene dehydrogenase-related protein [Thermoguttaceae bacterium]